MRTRGQQQIKERKKEKMRYKTKVTVSTHGKVFEPGSILPDDISKSDLAFLKSKKFVEPADILETTYGEVEDMPEDDPGQEYLELSGFNMMEPKGLKSPDEIRKIRSKKEVATYAETIGLNLGENYEEKSLKDLQSMVIDFQEEQVEGKADGSDAYEVV